MKVLFVTDFNSYTNPGGAQFSNRAIIEKGQELGFDITEHNWTSSKLQLLPRYDLVISSNFQAHAQEKGNHIFNYVVNHPLHVRYEHDSCHYLLEDARRTLFLSSKLNFFLSDFHLEFFQHLYGNIFKNNTVVYDPIDVDIFQKSDCKKIYDVMYCGYAHEHKGFKEFLNYAKINSDKKLAFLGWFTADTINLKEDLDKLNNIESIEKVEPEEVYKYLQKTKAIFHKPIVREPFCRMVAEALLCGCELIGHKDKIGSYLEYTKVGEEEFRNKCRNASTLFWEKIKEL
mgnify:CR=1 FL=1